MNYVTTNIRLPEDLWKKLKSEASEKHKTLSQIIRERLLNSAVSRKKIKNKSLFGIWKGAEVPEKAFEEGKRSLFPSPRKFI